MPAADFPGRRLMEYQPVLILIRVLKRLGFETPERHFDEHRCAKFQDDKAPELFFDVSHLLAVFAGNGWHHFSAANDSEFRK